MVVLGLVASLASPPAASAGTKAAPSRLVQNSPPASYPDTVRADSPLVYYRLGEASGSVAKDSSGNGVDGTYGSGAVRGVAGAIAGDANAAVSGNGTVVTAPASSLPAGKSARTLEIWYKASDLSFNNWPIMSYGSGANHGIALTFSVGGGSAALVISNDQGNTVSFSLPFDDMLWHLYDVTYDGTSVTGYVDGQAIGTAVLPLDTKPAGTSLDVGGGTGSYDEAAVYPTALSAARIGAHWTRGQSAAVTCAPKPGRPYPSGVLADKPLVYYRLGDGSRLMLDSSGHCANAARVSDDATSTPGALAGDSNAGVTGDGTVAIASAASLPAGKSARTLEIWYKASDLSANNWPIMSYGSGVNRGFGMTFSVGDGQSALVITNDQGNTVSFSLPFDDTLWHLYDVTYNGTKVTGYVDGQAIGTAVLPLNTKPAGTSLDVGGGTGSYDEAAVYPTALSAARIGAHWTRGESAKVTCAARPAGIYPAAIRADAPRVYYRLGDGSRLMLDSSGHCANAARVSDDATSTPGAIAGDPNAAVMGDGTTVIASASSLPAGKSARTLEIWYKASALNFISFPLISYGSSGASRGFGLTFNAGDGSSALTISDDKGNNVSFGLPYNDTLWHLYDITYDGSTVTAYADGRNIGSAPMTLDTKPVGTALDIGSSGSEDEAAVYPTALSPARITAHWLASGNAPPAGGAPGAQELPPGGNLSESCSLGVIHACSADPVDDESGAFGESVADLSIPGRGLGLDWSRSYSSAAAGSAGPLGFGWAGTYTAHLSVDQSTGDVTVVQEDGSQLQFTPVNGGFTAPPRVQATLTLNGDGSYTLVRKASETLVFTASGQLASLADRNGITTSLSYTAGNLSSVTDAAGRSLTFTWSGGHITQVADSTGRKVSYTYNSAGDLASVTDVAGGVTKYGYDSSHQLTSVLDPAQATAAKKHPLTNVYDTAGRVTSQTDQLGRTTTFAYSGDPGSGTGGTTLVTDPSGHQTLNSYENGERVSMTQGHGTPAATTTTFRYDPATLGLTDISIAAPGDPNDHSEQFSYNAQGLPVTEVDGLGHVTELTYNSFGEVLTETVPDPSPTGPATVTTTNTYDSAGNLLSTSTPLYTSATKFTALATKYIRGDSARPDLVTAVVDPRGNTTTFGYDAAGDQTSVTTPEGRKTARTFDALGRLVSSVAPAGNVSGANPADFTTTYTYDPAGRLLSTSVANGSTPLVTTRTYDPDGRPLTVTDPAGRTTTSVWDRAGELTQTKRPDGSVVKTSYWPDGAVHTQADGAGDVTSYTEDSLGRTVSRTDPLGRTTSYTYDGAGNVLTTTDPAGQVTTSSYNNDGQEISRSYSSSSMHSVSETYNAAGMRTAMTDGTGTSTWQWDSLRRLTSHHQAGGTVSYGYDRDGNLTKITYPPGKSVTRSYGGDGEMTTLKDLAGATTTFGYSPDGQLATTRAPNGLTTTDTYNDPDELTGITVTKGAATVASLTDGRNPDGQVTAETSTGLGVPKQAYSYNKLSQVTGLNGAAIGYDAADNLTRVPGGVTQAYNPADEVTGQTTGGSTISYTYNKDGSRAGGSGPHAVSYAYDQEQELTGYTSGTTTAAYTYDGDGLRQAKTVNGTTSAFAYDNAEGLPLVLTDGTNSYVYGPGTTPVEQVNNKTHAVTYLTSDQLGSVRLLTGAAGTITGTASYGPYGTRTATGTAASPFGFAGQYRDPESGLIWMRARYYDPATGQFITLDPQVTLTRSPYSYADGDPTSETDPTGDGFLGDAWQAWGSAVKSVAKDTVHGVTNPQQLSQDALSSMLTHFDPSPNAIAAKTDIQVVLGSINILRCATQDLEGAGTAGFVARQCYDPSTGKILPEGSSPADSGGIYNRVGHYACDQYGNLYYDNEGYYEGGQYHPASNG
jgi:RHS repeat-associated protein